MWSSSKERNTTRWRAHAEVKKLSIVCFFTSTLFLCTWFWNSQLAVPPHTHTRTRQQLYSLPPSLPGGLCRNDLVHHVNRGSVRSWRLKRGGWKGCWGGFGALGAGIEGDLKVKHKHAHEQTNTHTHWECVCGASIIVRHGGWAH